MSRFYTDDPVFDYECYCEYLDSLEPDYEEIRFLEDKIEEIEWELDDFKGVDLESLSDDEYGKYEDLSFNLEYYKRELESLKG